MSLSTYVLANMSARDLKAHMTGMTGWKALRDAHGYVTASMSKALLIAVIEELQGGGVPAPRPSQATPASPFIPATPATPDPIAEVPAEVSAPEVPADVPADGDPLASLRGILSPALLAEADKALAVLLASTTAAVALEASRAAEATAQAERLADALRAAGKDAPAPSPAKDTKSTTFLAPLAPVAMKPLREVLGVRSVGAYGDIVVPVYASPDALPVDPDYIWPEGSGMLVAALTRGEHVFIYGDAGTGKTSFGEQFSARCGRPYFAISFASDKASYDLIGSPMPEAGSMVWKDGELLAAMQTPGAVISLEELGFARSDLVAALLSALQGGFVNLPGRRVRVAPGVSFLATNNDDGTGSRAGRYTGLRPVNAALLDRFALRHEFTSLVVDREVKALIGRCPALNREVARRMVDYRKAVSLAVERGEAEHGLGLRRLIAWGSHVAAGLPSLDGFRAAILNASPIDDREFYQTQAVAMLPHDRIDAAQAGTGTLADAGSAQPDLPGTGDTPERSGFQPL